MTPSALHETHGVVTDLAGSSIAVLADITHLLEEACVAAIAYGLEAHPLVKAGLCFIEPSLQGNRDFFSAPITLLVHNRQLIANHMSGQPLRGTLGFPSSRVDQSLDRATQRVQVIVVDVFHI